MRLTPSGWSVVELQVAFHHGTRSGPSLPYDNDGETATVVACWKDKQSSGQVIAEYFGWKVVMARQAKESPIPERANQRTHVKLSSSPSISPTPYLSLSHSTHKLGHATAIPPTPPTSPPPLVKTQRRIPHPSLPTPLHHLRHRCEPLHAPVHTHFCTFPTSPTLNEQV